MEMGPWQLMDKRGGEGSTPLTLLRGQRLWQQLLFLPAQHQERLCGQQEESGVLDFYRIINYTL